MKKIMILFMVGVLAFMLGATSVVGVDPANVTVTFNSADTILVGESQDTQNAEGGNISNLSITQTSQTSYWHAFYGDVVKTILLADNSGHNVYDWGAQNLGGWVYFSNATGVDWSTVVVGNAADRADEDSALGLIGGETVVNTFSAVPAIHPVMLGVGGDIGADSAVGVNTSSNGGTVWSTILLRSGAAATDAAIYAGAIQQDNENYAGGIVDFQIMVPVFAGTGVRTYNVYAGLE